MKQSMSYFLVSLFGLLFFSSTIYSQTATIRIIDENTSEPCSFANVVLYDLQGNYIKGTTSDGHGEVIFEISEKSKIEVSYVGYVKYSGFISPGESIDIQLKQDFLELETVVVTKVGRKDKKTRYIGSMLYFYSPQKYKYSSVAKLKNDIEAYLKKKKLKRF